MSLQKRNKDERVLSIRDLNISFETSSGMVKAIRGVRMDLYRGETIAIVGESGSGKSVTVKTIMGIMASNGRIDSGTINYTFTNENGERETVDLTKMTQKEIRYRFNGKHIAMVFQDPMTSLDPTMTIGRQIMEPILLHENVSKEEAQAKALKLLEEVGIENPEKRFKQYPHQLSGGMRQRVVIAIALSCNPDMLICDEPTTALDVTIQAKILELIQKLQKEHNIAVIYITHDLGVVAMSMSCMQAVLLKRVMSMRSSTIHVIHIHGDCWLPCRIRIRIPNVCLRFQVLHRICWKELKAMLLHQETLMHWQSIIRLNHRCIMLVANTGLLPGFVTLELQK